MLDRDACERRVYRLATLLTGDPKAAVRVIEAAVGAQPDLRHLDGAHLDRLTVLRSREIESKQLSIPGLAPNAAAALASLTSQQREAWLFVHVYRLVEREIARAMDCSIRAVEGHLIQADTRFAVVEASIPEAARIVLTWSMSFDVPPFYRAGVQRRLFRRMVARWSVRLVIVAVLAAGGWFLWRIIIADLPSTGPAGTEQVGEAETPVG